MAIPKFTEGTLYVDRDKDVRNESWGPYVKIGIVRDGKTPEQRVRELQTGNPRKVHTIKTYFSPMVESLETRLHHNFASRWVRGEWFEMDEAFVEDELDKKINAYILEQKEFINFHKERIRLGSLPSDSKIREPTSEELELHNEYIEIKIKNDVLTAKSQILKSQMMTEMGDGGGVTSILKLTKRTTPEKTAPARLSFDRDEFQKEHPELYHKLVVISETTPKGNLTMKKIPTLAKINPELKKQEKDSNDFCNNLKHLLCDHDAIYSSAENKRLHSEYILLLGELFNTDLQMERIKSKFAYLLGENEAIDGIIHWKRISKINEKLDSEIVKKEFPEIYEDCLIEIPEKITPEKITVAIEVEMYREYVL